MPERQRLLLKCMRVDAILSPLGAVTDRRLVEGIMGKAGYVVWSTTILHPSGVFSSTTENRPSALPPSRLLRSRW